LAGGDFPCKIKYPSEIERITREMSIRGKYLEEYQVGETFQTPGRTITEADVGLFAGLTGDYNELHTNAAFMKESQFGERLVHGLLGLSVSVGLFFRLGFLEGTVIAFLGIEDWQFKAPIFFGDTLNTQLTVTDVKPSTSKPDRGVLRMELALVNQDGVTTQSGKMAFLIKARHNL